MMDLYAENILEHYKNPQGKCEVRSAKCEHTEKNISCGDEITIQLKIEDNKISEIGWSGTGCAISQAAMSMLSAKLEGSSTEEIEKLNKEEILEMLGVPIGISRMKCALLCLHTLKNALRIFSGEEPQSWIETVEVSN